MTEITAHTRIPIAVYILFVWLISDVDRPYPGMFILLLGGYFFDLGVLGCCIVWYRSVCSLTCFKTKRSNYFSHAQCYRINIYKLMLKYGRTESIFCCCNSTHSHWPDRKWAERAKYRQCDCLCEVGDDDGPVLLVVVLVLGVGLGNKRINSFIRMYRYYIVCPIRLFLCQLQNIATICDIGCEWTFSIFVVVYAWVGCVYHI